MKMMRIFWIVVVFASVSFSFSRELGSWLACGNRGREAEAWLRFQDGRMGGCFVSVRFSTCCVGEGWRSWFFRFPSA